MTSGSGIAARAATGRSRVRVRRCSSRRCPAYSSIWAQDTRRRLFENLRTLKLAVMFSVTAPGADLYPFDPRWCSHSPSTRCSGRIGCRVDPELARAFNQRVSPWWSELHRVAKLRADRATGFKGTHRRASLGEAEAGSRSHAWRPVGVDAGGAARGPRRT